MKPVAALSSVLLLCGCASPFGSPAPMVQVTDGLQLAAQPSTAIASGSSALTLYNGAAAPIGQNLCFAALEQLRGGLWVPAVSVARNCPEVFHPLQPGQQASAEAPLPAAAEGGTYRFVTRVHVPLGSVAPAQVRSNRFKVVPLAD